MVDSSVRFITLDGKASDAVYTVDERGPDRRGMVLLTGESGSVRVHNRRIIPESAIGKAIGIGISGKARIVCPKPKCYEVVSLSDHLAHCSVHGDFGLYMQGGTKAAAAPSAKAPKKPRKEPKMKDTAKDVAAPIVDLDEVAKHGELWTKKNDFDHASFDTRGFVLLADEPPRKLCFNTYNGRLSKRSRDPAKELGLAAFAANTNGHGSTVAVLALKSGLEAERTRLTKTGYKPYQQ